MDYRYLCGIVPYSVSNAVDFRVSPALESHRQHEYHERNLFLECR